MSELAGIDPNDLGSMEGPEYAGKPCRCQDIDAVYSERDQLVAALSHHYDAHLARHVGEWEEDWRNIVCVHLPTGQATWHIHDSELPLFWHLQTEPNHWDGHSTDEKYMRLAQAYLLTVTDQVENEIKRLACNSVKLEGD